MKITMIGHSTVLIEAAGLRIITDPYFGQKGNLAYKRLTPPARRREDVRNVDLVLMSHNHWDHTDRRYLHSLSNQVPVLAPASRGWLTRLKGAQNVVGLRAWQHWQFRSVRVTATPALHIAVTIGFLLDVEGKRVYFVGDTYYGEFMERIAAEFPLNVAMLPVTAYRIPTTMGEKSAVRAVKVLSPEVVIPIHLGIAPRSPVLRTNESAKHFRERVSAEGLQTEVAVLEEGQSWEG